MININLNANFKKHIDTLRPLLDEALSDLKYTHDYTLRFLSDPIILDDKKGSVLHYISTPSDSASVRAGGKLGDIIITFANEHNL